MFEFIYSLRYGSASKRRKPRPVAPRGRLIYLAAAVVTAVIGSAALMAANGTYIAGVLEGDDVVVELD